MEQLVKERLAVNVHCPHCGSYFYSHVERDEDGDAYDHCNSCGRSFGYAPPADINLKRGFEEPPIMADTGCKQATELLGCQSSCWECPFEDCKTDRWSDVQWHMIDTITPKIIAAYKAGTSKKDIATALHIGKQRVNRVIASLVSDPVAA